MRLCHAQIVFLSFIAELLCIAALWLCAKLRDATGAATAAAKIAAAQIVDPAHFSYAQTKIREYEKTGDRAELLSIGLIILLVLLTVILVDAALT